MSGTTATSAGILPGSTAGTYTVKAIATPLPSCNDTATLQVVQVTFSADPFALCELTGANLGFSVNPPSALSLLSFDTVTNISSGSANTAATVAYYGGTNLSIYGAVAGTAYLRTRLGNTTIYGPTIQIVRVTFPTNAWYVGVGKTADYTVTIIPANAAVTFDTSSNSIATATAIAGGVRVTGVAPGTTQVRAKVGSGSVCSTKNVTVVRATFATNVVALCNSNSATVAVAVDPPDAPVTYSASNSNIVQLTVVGTNVTITAKKPGTAIVSVRIGGNTLDWLKVKSVLISFPTNAWFALRGSPHVFPCIVSPQLYARLVNFSLSASNIATLAPAPPRLTVTGLTNGTTLITAGIGTNQFCASKYVTIFSAQLQTVEFTSDHNVICDGGDVLIPGNRFPNVEWNPGASVNAPMTHTAGTNSMVAATLGLLIDGLPNGTPFSIHGVSWEPALDLDATNTSASGANFVSVGGLSSLGKEIRTINESIAWELNIADNALALGDSGPHKIFTTLGTPNTNAPFGASLPNVTRMSIATKRLAKAIAWTNAPDSYTCYPRIVWRLMADLGNYERTVSLTNQQAWRLPSTRADCFSIARFVQYVCQVTGVPGQFYATNYAAIYAIAGDSNRPLVALEGSLSKKVGDDEIPFVHPGHPVNFGVPLLAGLDTNWVLALADKSCKPYGHEDDPNATPGGVGCYSGLNSFEGTLIYTDPASKQWYFPAGVKGNPRYDNKDAIVQLFASLVWIGPGDHDNNPNTPMVDVVKAVEFRYTRQTDVLLCP